MSFAEKARLLKSDPVTGARYFDHRFRELKKTWAEKDGPFFGHEISEYFFRVEFQHRGMNFVSVKIKNLIYICNNRISSCTHAIVVERCTGIRGQNM